MKRFFDHNASGLLIPRRGLVLPRPVHRQRGFVCVNPYIGGAPKVLTYQNTYDDTTAQTIYSSFAGGVVPFGTADASRRVHVVVHAEDATTTYSISSATIGGVSATINVQEPGTNITLSAILTANVPTGTTGTVSITFSEAIVSCSIGVWSSTGLSSDTAFATATSIADPGTATLNTTSGGFILCGWTHATVPTPAITVSGGVTERYNADTTILRKVGADAVTTGSNISPSGDYDGGTASRSAVFATF